MTQLRVETHENRTEFAPLDTVDGLALWELPKPPRWVEARLYWNTQGKGTQDVRVVDKQRWENPQPTDAQVFSLHLPAGPWSYSGTLVSIQWGVEIVAEGTKDVGRVDLIVRPRTRAEGELDLSMPVPEPET